MKTNICSINIIIADDHEIIRNGLAGILQAHPRFNLVAQAFNGQELIDLTGQFLPDVILTDIKMPQIDGIEATAIITKKYPKTNVVAYSLLDNEEVLLSMLQAGAKGYVVKNSPVAEICQAVIDVCTSGSFFCSTISHKMKMLIADGRLAEHRKNNRAKFSLKEKNVIELICREFISKEISEELSMSIRTVEAHRISIHKKMSKRNSVGILAYAVSNKMYVIN